MRKPDYCSQCDGACLLCSLANYMRDCQNTKIWMLSNLAEKITGGNLRALAKLLNDVAGPQDGRFDEIQPDPNAMVSRPLLIDLAAARAGDRVGRLAAEALRA